MPISLDNVIAQNIAVALKERMPILYHELENLFTDNLLETIIYYVNECTSSIAEDTDYSRIYQKNYHRKKRLVYQRNYSRFEDYLNEPSSVNIEQMKHIDVVKFYIRTHQEKDYLIRTERIDYKKFDSYVLDKVTSQLKMIEAWSKDKAQPFTNYLFFGDFKSSEREKLIREDLTNFIIDSIRHGEIEKILKAINNGSSTSLIMPISLVQSNQVVSNRTIVELDSNIITANIIDTEPPGSIIQTEGFVSKNINSNYFYPKETILKTYGIDSVNELTAGQQLAAHGLIPEDYQTFFAIASFKNTTNYIEDKINYSPIRVTIDQLREKLYPNATRTLKKHRELILSSIARLTDIGLGYTHDRIERLASRKPAEVRTYFRIINAISINTGDNIFSNAFNIYLSPFIYDELVNKKTIKLFGHYTQQLKGPELAFSFPLQLRRLSLHASLTMQNKVKNAQSEFDDHLSIEFFRSIYNVKSAKSKLVMVVNNSLKKLRENNLIVESFKYDLATQGFLVKYLPVTDEEYNEFSKDNIDSNDLTSIIDSIKLGAIENQANILLE